MFQTVKNIITYSYIKYGHIILQNHLKFSYWDTFVTKILHVDSELITRLLTICSNNPFFSILCCFSCCLRVKLVWKKVSYIDSDYLFSINHYHSSNYSCRDLDQGTLLKHYFINFFETSGNNSFLLVFPSTWIKGFFHPIMAE